MSDKIESAYYISSNQSTFRPYELAKIIGIVFCTPDGLPPRACYHLRYFDGVEDYTPISNSKRDEIVPISNIELVKKDE